MRMPCRLPSRSCISCTAYLKWFEDVFTASTFPYFEEHVLTLRCRHVELTMLYEPDICVEHIEDATTDSMKRHRRDKRIFVLTNYLRSLQVLGRYVNWQERINVYLDALRGLLQGFLWPLVPLASLFLACGAGSVQEGT